MPFFFCKIFWYPLSSFLPFELKFKVQKCILQSFPANSVQGHQCQNWWEGVVSCRQISSRSWCQRLRMAPTLLRGSRGRWIISILCWCNTTEPETHGVKVKMKQTAWCLQSSQALFNRTIFFLCNRCLFSCLNYYYCSFIIAHLLFLFLIIFLATFYITQLIVCSVVTIIYYYGEDSGLCINFLWR